MVCLVKELEAFREKLARDPDHLAQVLIGPACENWLRTELRIHLNRTESTLAYNQFAYDEDQNRDISIYDDLDGQLNCTHALELKVIYPLPPSKRKESYTKLNQQTCRQKNRKHETKFTIFSSIIFYVWTSYYNEKYECEEFFSKSEREILENLQKHRAITNHELKLTEILGRHSINWRKKDALVCMRAIGLYAPDFENPKL